MHLRCAATATILAVLSLSAATGQTPLGTGFTYQGQLKQNGQPYNGSANVVFRLFDASSGGNLLGTQTLSSVNVSGGLFTVVLDANGEFGSSAFNGASRWLDITANGTALSPRQALTAAPYATFSEAPWVTNGSNISYTAGDVSIGTASTTAGLQIKHEPASASGTLALEGNTHTYMTFYPDGFAAGRKGYLGFPGPSINNINLANEMAGGGLALVPGTGGNVEIDGKVGIDLANPTASLHVNGNIGVGVANLPAGLTSELGGTYTPILNLDVNFRHPNLNTTFVGGALRIDSRQDGSNSLFQFLARPAGLTTETVIASIGQAGALGIGTGTPGAKLELHSGGQYADILFTLSGHSKRGYIQFTDNLFLRNDVSGGGAARLEDDGSWSTSSDRRFKRDITPAAGLLDQALALRPVEFYMKDQDVAHDPQRHLGLIAQEVQPVVPEVVHGSDMLSLDYARIGVVAIGAIQEQQAIITTQKKTIDQQQARIDDLVARVEKLEALARGAATPSAH